MVRIPAWYWVVAVIALLWEAIGCYFYVTQVSMDAAALARMPEAQAELFAAMPSWQWGAYAVAVWIGLAGAIGLLLRRRWALTALAVSLLAALVQYGYTFAATDIMSTIGPSAIGLPAAIIIIGILLVLFAATSARKGWLR